MKKQNSITLINKDYLKNKIYEIRNQKVMLDSDLAEIYGITTKRLNEQVKRNILKFDEDFMFILTKEEVISVRSQNATSRSSALFKGQDGGTRYLPKVFTEQGVYMLMTILNTSEAIEQSKTLIRLFKSMKDNYYENKNLLSSKNIEQRTELLEHNVLNNTKDINSIRFDLNKVMTNFTDSSNIKEFLILNGKKLEADYAYKTIFGLAKKSIVYIDDYINLKTLLMLSNLKDNMSITLITDNLAKDRIMSFMIKDFNKQNPSVILNIIKNNNKCHDRFIVVDFNTKNETIYHCGTSLKDAGNKITTIIKLSSTKEYHSTINKLLKNSPISFV